MTQRSENGLTLVTPSEIASLAGVGPSAVSNWRSRSNDFPPSVTRSGHVDLFDLSEVVEWLRSNGRISADTGPVETYLLLNADHLRGMGLTQALASTFVVLTALRYAARSGEDLRTFAQLSDAAVISKITVAGQDAIVAGDLGPSDLETYFSDLPTAVPAYRDLIDVYLASPQPADLPDAFLDAYMNRLGRPEEVEQFTPPMLRQVMAGLAWAGEGARQTLLDPACGTGSLLAAAYEQAGHPVEKVYGIDINQASASMARARFGAAGIPVQVTSLDTLAHDPFTDLHADSVVCDPPWGLSPASVVEPRLAQALGRVTSQNVDLAWAYYAVDHLGRHGRAVVAMPPGVLFRSGSEASARFELLRRGCIAAVIAMPSERAARSSIDAVLLVLRAPNTERRANDVLFIDATDPGTLDLTGPDLDVVNRLVDNPSPEAFNDLTVDQNEVIIAVPVLDLLAPEATLNPAYWLSYKAGDPESLTADASHAGDVLAQIQQQMADCTVPSIATRPGREPRLTTLGALVDQGLIKIHTTPPFKMDDSLGDHGVPVITPTFVHDPTGGFPGYLDPDDPAVARARLTQPGDVLLSRIGVRAIVDLKGGAYPAGSLLVIEQIGEKPTIPAQILATVLSTSNTTSLASDNGNITRQDLAKVVVPVLDAEDAQRLDDLLQRLSEGIQVAARWQKAADHTREVMIRAAMAGVYPV